MAEKFVVKKGTTGKFRFSLVGRNGKVIASSETYNSKAACMNGIKAVQAGAGRAEVEDQTTKAWADEQTRIKGAARSATRTAKSAANTVTKTAAKTARAGTGTAKAAAGKATRTAKSAANTATKTAAKTVKVATGTARTATKTAKAATRTAAEAAKQPGKAAGRR